MRNYVSLIFVLVFGLFCFPNNVLHDEGAFDCELNNRADEIISQCKLYDKINQKQFLFYCTGHVGIVWSIVVREDVGYLVYYGNTSDEFVATDTIGQCNEIIQWGFDSLYLEAKTMKMKKINEYSPVKNVLEVYDDNCQRVFADYDMVIYGGYNSEIFNEKLRRLKYMMFWLSAPEIRNFSPSPF